MEKERLFFTFCILYSIPDDLIAFQVCAPPHTIHL